jgi:hypothetical protein
MDITFYKKAKMTVPLMGEDGKQQLDKATREPLTQVVETVEDISFETHESELLKSALHRFTKLYKSEFKDFVFDKAMAPERTLKQNGVTADTRILLKT